MEAIRRHVDPGGVHEVRYEDVVDDTRSSLRSLCSFLGVGADARYLDACAAIVTRQPEPSRAMVEWTNPWITTVERRLADHGFLQGYSYDG